jgi:hypothetical protein
MERGRVAGIPFFADLPEDVLAAVAGAASELEIDSGQTLTAEGHIGIRCSPSRAVPPTSS